MIDRQHGGSDGSSAEMPGSFVSAPPDDLPSQPAGAGAVVLAAIWMIPGGGQCYRCGNPTQRTGLKRAGWPKDRGIEVECFNCNMGSWRNGGVCPHKETA